MVCKIDNGEDDEQKSRWVTNWNSGAWIPVEGQEKNMDPTPVIKIDTGRVC